MKLYEIMDTASRVRSGLNLSLQNALQGRLEELENYDIFVNHNDYIVIMEREEFINCDSETGEEYLDERWNDIVVISVVDDKFTATKIWSYPVFDVDNLLLDLDHLLASKKDYFKK